MRNKPSFLQPKNGKLAKLYFKFYFSNILKFSYKYLIISQELIKKNRSNLAPIAVTILFLGFQPLKGWKPKKRLQRIAGQNFLLKNNCCAPKKKDPQVCTRRSLFFLLAKG